MGVQQSLLTAFQTAKPQTTRFLKVLIVDEQATLALTIPPKGSDKDDFALIAEQGEISDSQAAYYLCLLDGGKGWLFITYVPDGAKVREKMMYSSSKSRLLKALGEASFTDSLHATSPADLTVRGYAAHLKAQAAPHPLTERERALQEVKQAEYEASKEDAFRGTGGGVRGGAGPLSAVMGVGAGLEWGEGVEEALKEVASESSSTSGDKCTVVGLQIDPKVHTRLNLALSTSTTLDELRTHLPAEGPQYTIFSYLPSGAARPVVVFVYSCPPKSPIRTRMVYSSSVSSLISKIKERAGVEIDKKVETSEPASLTKTEILSELAPVLSRSSAASQPGRSSSLPTPAPIRTNGLARPVGPAHSASFGAADAAAAAKASPSPTVDSPTSVAPDALANPASFAKPKGPPRRTGAGRVAAARAAFESGSSSPA